MQPSASNFTENVLPVWLEAIQNGHQACLITLVGIEGSAPRPLGSQMAVSSDGHAVGYITGGCAEAALIAEAMDVIATGQPRLIRLGEGSPYKDISLPCGSGIDVYLHPSVDMDTLAAVQDQLKARQPCQLHFNLKTQDVSLQTDPHRLAERQDDVFIRPYTPPLALYIAGKGPIVPALATLATESGFQVYAASPETETLAAITHENIITQSLTAPEDFSLTTLDAWSALITLFHDHEWEPPILAPALDSEAFYIGALGSRRTHELRTSLLEDMDINIDKISKIHGPVGVDIQATTPSEIAISILADIIKTYRMRERGPARW